MYILKLKIKEENNNSKYLNKVFFVKFKIINILINHCEKMLNNLNNNKEYKLLLKEKYEIKETINKIELILNESNLKKYQKDNILILYKQRIILLEKEINELVERRNNLDKEIEFHKNINEEKIPKYEIKNGKLILNDAAEIECLILIKNGIIKNKNQYPAYKDQENAR